MLRFILLTVALCYILGLSACVSHPQNAQAFRKAISEGAFLTEVDTFEVNRPFRKVAKTFQKMATGCLNKTIKTTSRTNRSYQVIVTTYKATVVVNPNKAELHVQQLHEQGVMNVSKVPPGGYYLVVTDIEPVGRDKTKIVMYRPSAGSGPMIKAIKGWATGENVGCPDFTA
jgi:hypothetical protein